MEYSSYVGAVTERCLAEHHRRSGYYNDTMNLAGVEQAFKGL
jgi:hypothetical protein